MIAAASAGYLNSTALLDLNLTEALGNGPEVALAMHVNLDRFAAMLHCSITAALIFTFHSCDFKRDYIRHVHVLLQTFIDSKCKLKHKTF